MRNYPLEKYRFYFAGNKIIAASTYAGRVVRGVAVCHGDDEFDIEYGKRLAAARCNEKIATKRYERASLKFAEANDAVFRAKEHAHNMSDYYKDSFVAMNEASQAVDMLLAEKREG